MPTLTHDPIEQDESIFRMTGSNCLKFAAGDDKNKIRLTLYDGSITPHWFWGNIAFDLETMKLAKAKIPILLDHDTGRRLGFSTGASFDGKFVLEGKLLQASDDARTVRADAGEGFPFESSLRFDPDRSITVDVPRGQSETVNGRKLSGPGTIVKNAVIMEGSVTTFGALNNTKSQIFQQRKDRQMDQQLTLETFKAEHADLHDQVVKQAQTDAEAQYRADFAQYKKICGSETDLLIQAFEENLEMDTVLELKTERLNQRETALAARETELSNTAQQNDGDQAALEEFTASDSEAAQQKKAAQSGGKPADNEDGWRAEFAASEQLQDEFGPSGVEDYVSFKQAEKKELVKIKNS